MEEKQTLICDRCKAGLTLIEAQFSYLESKMCHEVPRCPKCGQVFLSEELVSGRIHKLEEVLEEK